MIRVPEDDSRAEEIAAERRGELLSAQERRQLSDHRADIAERQADRSW